MAKNSKVPDPELVDTELRVLELRRAGMIFDEIAKRTGYRDASGAYHAYRRAIQRTMQQPADELRQQELDRLDRLTLAAWPNAMKGDTKSILAIAKLMERRAKLIGLDKPIKIEQEVTTWDGSESIDRAVRDLAALLTANDESRASTDSMASDSSESESITASNELAQLVDSLGSRMGQDTHGSGMDNLGSIDATQDPLGGNSQDIG